MTAATLARVLLGCVAVGLAGFVALEYVVNWPWYRHRSPASDDAAAEARRRGA